MSVVMPSSITLISNLITHVNWVSHMHYICFKYKSMSEMIFLNFTTFTIKYDE